VTQFSRAGHLESFTLPGGDAAVRNPYRVALSLLSEAGIDADLPTLEAVPAWERTVAWSQLKAGVGCVRTTSAGRLFDGVASLIGICHRITYEAQAAIELEAAARSAPRAFDLEIDLVDGVLKLAPLISGLVDGLRSAVPVEELALGFHQALAKATVQAVLGTANDTGIARAGLTGGVFQNRILLDAVRRGLTGAGIEVVTHHRVPPNDGGLALGQAVVARASVHAGRLSGKE
jgi:hydrogenase maturation protein HypF